MQIDKSVASALASRYRIEGELGSGAMGTVYRAHDIKLDRKVAIKVLHPALTNEVGAARFQAEIRAVAMLRHDGIVSVHEAGEADGRLYFAMDLLEGESLRDRLTRDKQLPVDEAIALTGQIAAALQHAHDRRIVHRDIKPDNIIMCDGRAIVVDFGLARVLSDADTQRLTASGLSVGTPHYLSPEQASAEREIGPAADQYALACVLFEMIAGEPPFTGPTATSIAMRHISEPAPALRMRRRTTTAPVDVAVLRAMEKVPADRYRSVSQFAAALSDASIVAPVAIQSRKQRRLLIAGALALIAGLVALAAVRNERTVGDAYRSLTGTMLDSSRIVVLTAGPAASPAASRLTNALVRWKGITVPSTAELNEAAGGIPVSSANAAAVARRLRASRFVFVEDGAGDNDFRVHASVFDAVDGKPYSTINSGGAGESATVAYEHSAYGILFPDAAAYEEASSGTHNVRAFAAFVAAMRALRSWKLDVADSSLTAARQHDEHFSGALLKLAEIRSWQRDAWPEVRQLASRALSDTMSLTVTERARGAALLSNAEGRFGDACQRYAKLVAADSSDFGLWYGLAECNRLDLAVVQSGSGDLRFRSSREFGAHAMDRAFLHLTSVDPCCAARAAQLIGRQYEFTSVERLRLGGQDDRASDQIFLAHAELEHDSLAFHPVSPNAIGTVPATSIAALERERRLLVNASTLLVRLAPNSADALELMATALDNIGAPSAADSMRSARRLGKSAMEQSRLAIREFWLRLKYALPDDQAAVSQSRLLADSILSTPQATKDYPSGVASVAAATGKYWLASQLYAIADSVDAAGEISMPTEIARTARWTLLLAASGAPRDTLVKYRDKLTTEIANGIAPDRQSAARTMWLGRIDAFAIAGGVPFTIDPANAAVPQQRLAIAAAARNRAAVLAQIKLIDATRIHIRPADVTLDALYLEAAFLNAVGERRAAEKRLSAVLGAIRLIPASQLARAPIAMSLSKCVKLYVELLREGGNVGASQKWQSALRILEKNS